MSDARPLTDAELDWLDAALARPQIDLPLSTADGFIAAMALSPEFIAPREWMASLFGAFEDKQDEAEITALAWRRHNAMLAALEASAFEPLFDHDEDGWPLGEIWAKGFLMGMDLRHDAWTPLLEHPAGAALMTPILALGDPAAMAEIEPRKAKRAREAGRLTALIPKLLGPLAAMTGALRDGRSLEGLAPAGLIAEIGGASPLPPATAPKAGRNDPCPCGSGQKFKRCCGAAA